MKNSYERLDAFLEKIKGTIKPDKVSEIHEHLSKEMVGVILEKCKLRKDAQILDVGCGCGVSLELFRDGGFDPYAITLSYEDREECMAKGFTKVFGMDQSFMDFQDGDFDLVWCRHCLEHSIMPFFTLSEFYRVLRPDGCLYVEVPAPDTACHHERHSNHYSTLGLSSWIQLLTRAGFDTSEYAAMSFETEAGPDTYWSFILRKKLDKPNGS